jgi:hypothetical protein
VIIGAAEIAIVWIAAVTTVITLPPAEGPPGRYQHVVSLRTVAVMTAVLIALRGPEALRVIPQRRPLV